MRAKPSVKQDKQQIKLNAATSDNVRRISCHQVFVACLFASTVFLNGCATHSALKTSNQKPPPVSAKALERQLTADFVYKYLVAEVAGQRGEWATSSSIFYDLAKTTRDADLAERAARVAIYGHEPALTISTIKLWSELDPSSTEAQQAMTEVLIATGKLQEAKPFLVQLLAKEETRAASFLYLNSLLSRATDKTEVLSLTQSLAKPYLKNSAEAQFAVAQSAWVAKQDDVALKALNQAEILKPGWSIAALLKGQILFDKSPQKAIDFYQEFLNQHSDANEVRLNMAKLLVSQKQYDAAKKQYPIIIQTAKDSDAKNSAEIHTIIGLLSFQATDYIAAEAYFQEALNLGYKDTDQIYIYLAQLAEKQSQDKLASSLYNKIESGPHYLEAQIGLASLIARTESVDKAIEKLDAINDLSTEQQVLVIQTEASILAKAKRDQDAFDLLHKAINHLPNTLDLVYDYALAAERVQKFDLMEGELRKAIQLKPDFAAAYNALGYSFADRSIRLDESLTLIEKALTFRPNDHYMLDSLGWVYYKKGNLDKAIIYLKKAYEVSQDSEIAAHLGEVLWQKGRHDEAKKIWNDALIADPDNELLLTTTYKFKS